MKSKEELARELLKKIRRWKKEREKELKSMPPEQRKRWEKMNAEIDAELERERRRAKRLEKSLSPEEKKLRKMILEAKQEWDEMFIGTHIFKTDEEAGKWASKVQKEARRKMKKILDAAGSEERIKKVLTKDEWEGSFGAFKRYLQRYKEGKPIVIIVGGVLRPKK